MCKPIGMHATSSRVRATRKPIKKTKNPMLTLVTIKKFMELV